MFQFDMLVSYYMFHLLVRISIEMTFLNIHLPKDSALCSSRIFEFNGRGFCKHMGRSESSAWHYVYTTYIDMPCKPIYYSHNLHQLQRIYAIEKQVHVYFSCIRFLSYSRGYFFTAWLTPKGSQIRTIGWMGWGGLTHVWPGLYEVAHCHYETDLLDSREVDVCGTVVLIL